MSDWVIDLIEQTGYVGVFLLMFLETIFPPVPSEVIMPIAGLSAARGQMTLWGVILSGTGGAMFGNIVLVSACPRDRDRAVSPVHRPPRPLADARLVRRRKGRATVRPLRRAGRRRRADAADDPLGRLDPRRPAPHAAQVVFSWSTVGTAVWSSALAIAGYLLGQQFRDIEKVVGPLSVAIIAAIVAAYVWRQLTWRKRHPKG